MRCVVHSQLVSILFAFSDSAGFSRKEEVYLFALFYTHVSLHLCVHPPNTLAKQKVYSTSAL